MKKLVSSIKKHRQFISYYIPFVYSFFTFIFLLLKFPQLSSEGVQKGVNLCMDTLIPSLYPFMVATEFLISSGLLFKSTKLISVVSEKMFGLPLSFPVFILSCLGGYPVGAECVNALYKKGSISKREGERMLLFSVNPSLNFVLSFVGFSLLKSIKAGLIIYLGVILSSVMLGVISRLIYKNSCNDISLPITESDMNFSSALTSSVKKAAFSMFYICAFTVFFSAVAELCTIIPFSAETKLLVISSLEVTNAVKSCYRMYSLPLVASVISFGGLSTVFQVLTVTSEMNLKAGKYILVRIVLAFMSFLMTGIILKFFPVALETFSSVSAGERHISSHSASVSVGLIIMTMLFLGGDYLTQQKRS